MQSDQRRRLLETLNRVPPDLFAVVDGAFFDDLRFLLRMAGLEGRPLFIDEMNETVAAAGPHLVHIPDNAAAVRLLDAMAETPAVVFWSWPSGANTLFSHLRKLNRVEIPVDGCDEEHVEFEHVIFRHADPNVMASTLSVLYIDQYLELLGDSAGLVMFASDFGGLKVVPRPKLSGPDA